MIAQYAVAGARRGLVVGTDHAAEGVMGFFTKLGYGVCVRSGAALGIDEGTHASDRRAPERAGDLVRKVPTADLEALRPQLPDETAFGIAYDEIAMRSWRASPWPRAARRSSSASTWPVARSAPFPRIPRHSPLNLQTPDFTVERSGTNGQRGFAQRLVHSRAWLIRPCVRAQP
ncbi:MAG: hypothetical protein Q8Q73_08275 [Stagnimonas sp.]|nr:hypothetical protein [Stagnimonas sp.]